LATAEADDQCAALHRQLIDTVPRLVEFVVDGSLAGYF